MIKKKDYHIIAGMAMLYACVMYAMFNGIATPIFFVGIPLGLAVTYYGFDKSKFAHVGKGKVKSHLESDHVVEKAPGVYIDKKHHKVNDKHRQHHREHHKKH